MFFCLNHITWRNSDYCRHFLSQSLLSIAFEFIRASLIAINVLLSFAPSLYKMTRVRPKSFLLSGFGCAEQSSGSLISQCSLFGQRRKWVSQTISRSAVKDETRCSLFSKRVGAKRSLFETLNPLLYLCAGDWLSKKERTLSLCALWVKRREVSGEKEFYSKFYNTKGSSPTVLSRDYTRKRYLCCLILLDLPL